MNHQVRNGRSQSLPGGEHGIGTARTSPPIITLHDTDSEPELEPEPEPEREPEREPEPEYITLDSDSEPEPEPENNHVPNPPPPRNGSIHDDDGIQVIPDPNQPGPSQAINRTPKKPRSLEDPRRAVIPMDDDVELEILDLNQPGPSSAINASTVSRSDQSRPEKPGPPEDARRVLTQRNDRMNSNDESEAPDSNQPGPSSAITRSGQSRPEKVGPLEDARRVLTQRNDRMNSDHDESDAPDSNQPGPSSAITRSGQSKPEKPGPPEDARRVLTERNDRMNADDDESEIPDSNQPGPSSAINPQTMSKGGRRKQSRPQRVEALEDSGTALVEKNESMKDAMEPKAPESGPSSGLRKRPGSNFKKYVNSESEHSEVGEDGVYTEGDPLRPVTDLASRTFAAKRSRKRVQDSNSRRNPDDVVDPKVTELRKCVQEGVYKDLGEPRDPGVNPPIGLGHTPYKPVKKPQLLVEIENTDGFVSSSMYLTPTSATRKQEAPEADDDDLRMMTEYRKEISIGSEFQVDVPKIEMITGNVDDYYGDEEEYEEAYWVPIGCDDHPTSQKHMKEYIDETRDVYWKAVWRQFDGHIPYEYALQNLMKNRYRIEDGLETIDECLLRLPEAVKPVCQKQAKQLMRRGLNDNLSMRKIRDTMMTNYHLDVVHNFHYQFIRFFILQHRLGVPCVCNKTLCEPLDFAPRIGCSNCTRHFWNEPSEASTSSERTQKLCLLCQTYAHVKNGPRPVKNLILTDEERHILEQWKRKEQESGKKLSLEDVKSLLERETMKRWQGFDLDKEEISILTRSDLLGNNLKKVPEMLQPFRLPLFSRCGCSNGGIPTNLPPTIQGQKPVITRQGLPWLPEIEYHRQKDPKTDATPVAKKRKSKKRAQE